MIMIATSAPSQTIQLVLCCQMVTMWSLSHGLAPSMSEDLYQIATVGEAVWPNYVVRTMSGLARSRIHCGALCHALRAICNGYYFDDSTENTVCQLSNIHQWRLTSGGEGKAINIKRNAIGILTLNENDVVYVPKLTQVQLKTHTDPGSEGGANTWLYLRVCLEDGLTCCDSDVFDHIGYNDYEKGFLDTYDHQTGLGPCTNFEVPDFRTSHIYMRHSDIDDWGGEYINVWFEDAAWFVKCVNPDGSGKIYLNHDDIMELECSVRDINNQSMYFHRKHCVQDFLKLVLFLLLLLLFL